MENDSNVQMSSGVTIKPHENFHGDKSDKDDIAVIRLHSPLTFNDYVQPVCLPSSAVADGTDCVVTGFGQTETGGKYDSMNFLVATD